jgi:hypothetical protein
MRVEGSDAKPMIDEGACNEDRERTVHGNEHEKCCGVGKRQNRG